MSSIVISSRYIAPLSTSQLILYGTICTVPTCRMHAMYVDLARSITQQQPSPSLSRKKRSGSSSSSSSTPTGGITGKQLKQSTTILRSNRKNHHQDEDEDDGQGLEGMPSYYRGGGGGGGSGSGTYNHNGQGLGQGYVSSGNTHTPGGINVRVPSVSFDASTGGGVRHAYRGGDPPHSHAEYSNGGSSHLMTTPNPPSSHSFYQSTNNGQGQGHEMNNGNNNNSNGHAGIASSSKNSDLASVIASLEEEFAVLNTQYRRLLASVQTQVCMYPDTTPKCMGDKLILFPSLTQVSLHLTLTKFTTYIVSYLFVFAVTQRHGFQSCRRTRQCHTKITQKR